MQEAVMKSFSFLGLCSVLTLALFTLAAKPAAHGQRGGGGNLSVSPTSLSFGNQVLGGSSTAKTVTVSNSRSSASTIAITVSGAYTESDNCGTSLAGGSSCTVSVIFTPTVTGSSSGSLSVQGSNNSQSVRLSGTGTAPTLSSITLSPLTPSILPGIQQQFTAMGTYNNGTTADVTASATWSSSSTRIATVSTGGLATAVAAGTATISASVSSSSSGRGGGGGRNRITGSTVLTVPSITAIAVTPAGVQLLPNSTMQYAVTATYSNGTTAPLTTGITWSSSRTSVATVSTAGLATSVAVGSATITASLSSGRNSTLRGTTVLTVTTNPLVSIAVTPNGISLGKNGTQQYVATGTYLDNTTKVITTSVTWTSGTPSVVSVSTGGLATVLGTSSSAIPITASAGNVVSPPSWLSALASLPVVCPTPSLDMKILVVTNGKTEADFGAITQILDYLGTPYTVMDFAATAAGITPDLLSDGNCHGYFQGVIFTTGGYIYTLPGMATLTSYEQSFGVRQVNWYTDPTPDFGLNFTSNTLSTTSTTTYSASFSTAAVPIFSYANTATPVTISNAFIYLTTPVAAASLPAGTSVTPLLTDKTGNALSAIYTFGDGRQYLTQTFDSNQYLTHDLVLAYGLINWVTKGIFLGDYHVYASPQVDDFFINDSEWIPGTPCTDPITHDRTAPDASSLPVFRLTYTDMSSIVSWQNGLQNDPLLKGFQLTLAFNGVGTTGNIDWTGLKTVGRTSDTLISNLSRYQQYFHWISHTYDHPATLNGLHKSDVGGDTDTPQVDDIDLEILTNMYVGNGTGSMLDTDLSDTTAPAGVVPLMFTDFNPMNLVSPGVTGLNDTLVPTYLYANGIRYVVTDTSVIGQPNNGPNPSPNVGIVNSYAPGIYEVPRYPNDVYYNAANWADDQAEFSCIYNNPVDPPFNTYNAAQILDFVSTSFVVNMLKGDMDPEMFHQPDLHFSNNAKALGLTGTHNSSLITDTYNQTFSKYEALYKLPVLSPTLDQLGTKMQARNTYNLSGATATLTGVNGAAPQITITVPAGVTVPSASIPVSGLNSTGAESYGGKYISHVTVNAGQTVTLPVK
jgi:Bacterial Ig-like domain (group 2)/Cep192 domain 4